MAGWDVAAGVYAAWTWATIWHRDPAATALLALREDPGPATADPAAGRQRGLSWAVGQSMFTSHDARLYYSHPAGGIDFNQEGPPRYSDFTYLAFTVGMTFQVPDTDLQTATTINLVAGLFR